MRTESVVRLRRHGLVGWAGALAGAVVLAGCAATDTATPPAAGTQTAPATVTVAHNPTPPFSAGVVPTTAPPHRLGDEVGFTMTTNATGYGHLYLLNASGKVVALVENLPVAGGVASAFPLPGSGLKLRASAPAGTERVLFLVTRERFAGFSGGAAASAPAMLSLGAEAFAKELNAATAKLAKDGWALAETRVEVVPAGS